GFPCFLFSFHSIYFLTWKLLHCHRSDLTGNSYKCQWHRLFPSNIALFVRFTKQHGTICVLVYQLRPLSRLKLLFATAEQPQSAESLWRAQRNVFKLGRTHSPVGCSVQKLFWVNLERNGAQTV